MCGFLCWGIISEPAVAGRREGIRDSAAKENGSTKRLPWKGQYQERNGIHSVIGHPPRTQNTGGLSSWSQSLDTHWLRCSYPAWVLTLLLAFFCPRKEHSLHHEASLSINWFCKWQKIRDTQASRYGTEKCLGSTTKKKGAGRTSSSCTSNRKNSRSSVTPGNNNKILLCKFP